MSKQGRLLFESLESRRLLTFVVDTVVDESDGDFSANDFSLREAIERANAQPGHDVITFSPALTGQTIALSLAASARSSLEITDSVEIQGPGSDLLTIDGSANDPTPDDNNADGLRVVNVTANNVAISGLTITGGDVNDRGGGLMNAGQLELTDVTFRDNHARGGGGLFSSGNLQLRQSLVSGNESNSSLGGGGIGIAGGSATIQDSVIRENEATFRGGGVAVYRGSAVIANTTISNNGCDFAGGGIHNEGSVVLIESSVVSGNSAARGGGVYTSGDIDYFYYYNPDTMTFYYYADPIFAQTVVTGSSISDNVASTAGGGLYSYVGSNTEIRDSTISGNATDGDGGGLSSYGDYRSYPFYSASQVTISQSTFSGNSASGDGGAIHEPNSTYGIQVSYSTITGNRADVDLDGSGRGGGTHVGYLYLSHTIVAGNSDPNGSPDVHSPSANTVAEFSLIGDNSGSGLDEAPVGSPDFAGNLIGGSGANRVDPQLTPLQDNGGFTRTHGLLPTSPAIDAGDTGVAAEPFDQRGSPFAREVGGAIDMGAYEWSPPTAVDGDFNDDGIYDCFDIDALVFAIVAGGTNPSFDMNGDGVADISDLFEWLDEAGSANLGPGREYFPGDGNLDGVVDVSDFNIWNATKFSPLPVVYGWCAGNYNADAVVDVADFNVWNTFKFTSASPPGPGVEPFSAAEHASLAWEPPREEIAVPAAALRRSWTARISEGVAVKHDSPHQHAQNERNDTMAEEPNGDDTSVPTLRYHRSNRDF